jgi:hypothetical protein
MADAEFDEPQRQELLKALKTALNDEVIPSTAWACIWLSDIDRLRELVHDAQMRPFLVMATFRDMERSVKIVQTCRFTNLIL